LDFTQHLDSLVALAQKNLSQAHVLQHTFAAELIRNEFQINAQGPGAYSVYKPGDSVTIDNNKLCGKKQWVSFLPHVSWMVLTVKHNQHEKVVFVWLDNTVQRTMVNTMGMEQTLTGHVEFDNSACQILCDVNDLDYFFIRRQQSLGFIANHFGLAVALFNDIDNFTNSKKIECSYQKSKLKLQLDVMEIIWNQLPKQITDQHRSQYFWQQKNTAYAFAKKCLVEICQFVTEITGSGIYVCDTEFHQRYKDALIYSTHMKNLYNCLT
jgi:hypothetical protein